MFRSCLLRTLPSRRLTAFTPSLDKSLSFGFRPYSTKRMRQDVPGQSPSLRDLKPPQRFGMTELDRSQFERDVPVLEAKIKAEEVNSVLKNLRG